MAKNEPKTHRLAWDRVAFCVPEYWNLSKHVLEKQTTRVTLEDDYTVRLEGEWLRLQKRPALQKVRERYRKAAKKLGEEAQSTKDLDSLPQGWAGYLYRFEKQQQLLVAFYLDRPSATFVFLRIHFGENDKESPRRVIQTIAESIKVYTGGLVPWEAFDLSLELPADFRLSSTVFQAGKKMLMFHWRLRRLFLWQVSLADMLLAREPLAEWTADLLNMHKTIKGPHFYAAADGTVKIRRNRWHPMGHFDEFGRLCFRYFVRCRHDQENNRIYIWLFNYRKESDLSKLQGHLGSFDLVCPAEPVTNPGVERAPASIDAPESE